MSKICKKCNQLKEDSEFSKHSITKDGLSYNCKECVSKEHLEKAQYYTEKAKAWKKENAEKAKFNSTKAKIKAQVKKLTKEASVTNINRQLKTLSCDLSTYKSHLGSQFSEPMSWKNYGEIWTIDFMAPLDSFNILNPEEVKKATHFSNIKPVFID